MNKIYSYEDLQQIDKAFREFEHEQNSDLLSKAKSLEDFLTSIFPVKERLDEYKKQAADFEVIYEFKRNFVQRRALRKYSKEDVKNYDPHSYIYKAPFALAKQVFLWLEDEQLHNQELDAAAQYCAYKVYYAPDSVAFQIAKKLDFENLVHKPSENIFEQSHGHISKHALNQSHYCIFCHSQSKDSCRTGLHDGEALKTNPLGNKLIGCPLDQKISEMNLLYSQGHIIAALAVVMIDNPLVAATGDSICNDCMKSCIYQKQEPVDVPHIETKMLQDILTLPYGAEIYCLLTLWHPLLPKSEINRTNAIHRAQAVLTYKDRLRMLDTRIPSVQFNLGLGLTPFPVLNSLSGERVLEEVPMAGNIGIKNELGLTPFPVLNSLSGERVLEEMPMAGNIEIKNELGLTPFPVLNSPSTINSTKHNILVVGLGPAGFAMAYYMLKNGHHVTAIDGLKIEPLPPQFFKPIKNWPKMIEDLGPYKPQGFGGVAEYGITDRWNKYNLLLIRMVLERFANFTMKGDFRLGRDITIKDAIEKEKYDYVALCLGAGKPKAPEIKNLDAKGVVSAFTFLASLHMNMPDFKYKMPVVIVGAGLTAIDCAMAALSYRKDQKQDVTIIYRKSIQDSPSYRENHHELQTALDAGVKFLEHTELSSIEIDASGHIISVNNILPASTLIYSIGTHLNDQIFEREAEAFKLYKNQIGIFGDMHPEYSGTVVKAIASVKNWVQGTMI